MKVFFMAKGTYSGQNNLMTTVLNWRRVLLHTRKKHPLPQSSNAGSCQTQLDLSHWSCHGKLRMCSVSLKPPLAPPFHPTVAMVHSSTALLLLQVHSLHQEWADSKCHSSTVPWCLVCCTSQSSNKTRIWLASNFSRPILLKVSPFSCPWGDSPGYPSS